MSRNKFLVIVFILFLIGCKESHQPINFSEITIDDDDAPKTNRRKLAFENLPARNEEIGILCLDSLNLDADEPTIDQQLKHSFNIQVSSPTNYSMAQNLIFEDTNEIPSHDKTDHLSKISSLNKNIYELTNFYQSRLVAITNYSTDKTSIARQDGKVIMIQEAKDEDGKWKPIEHWQYSKCGNSYWSQVISPRTTLLVKIFAYQGDFITKLRVKLKNGENVIYSKPFEGSIDHRQFNFHPDDERFLNQVRSKGRNHMDSIVFLNL